jgi:hypothetical protein
VFENRVLRRVARPNRDEVMREWRKLQNGKFLISYTSPDIITQIKSRRMRWAGHVAGMGNGNNLYGVLWESQKEKTT